MLTACAWWQTTTEAASRPISYGETVWTLQQGAPTNIRALAQTPDGYLWIGTSGGLFRFDGVTFEHVQSPRGEAPIHDVNAIAALPSGDLWLSGGVGGATFLHAGHAKRYEWPHGPPPGGGWKAVAERDGTIWVATLTGLGRFSRGTWQSVGRPDGLPEGRVNDVVVVADQTVWVSLQQGLYFRPAGASRFQSAGVRVDSSATGLSVGLDGRLWLLNTLGGASPLLRSSSGKFAIGPIRRLDSGTAPSNRLVARDNELIRSARGRGDGMIEAAEVIEDFKVGALAPGSASIRHQPLTLDHPNPELVDREGNIWIGMPWGLIRFRPVDFTTLDTPTDMTVNGYSSLKDGQGGHYIAWIAPGDPRPGSSREARLNHLALRHLTGTRIEDPATSIPPAMIPFPEMAGKGALRLWSLALDRQRQLWVAAGFGLWKLSGNRLTPIRLPEALAGRLVSFAIDKSGTWWATSLSGGLYYRAGGDWKEKSDVPLDFRRLRSFVRSDDQGRVWSALERDDDQLLLIGPGPTHLFTSMNGLRVGRVMNVIADGNRTLITGNAGLAEVKGAAARSLTALQLGGLSGITGLAMTARGDIWLNTNQGAAQIAARAWRSAFDDPDRPMAYSLLDFRNGLPGTAEQNELTPTAFVDGGRLWFLSDQGLASLDPESLERNPFPPPVEILSVMADGRRYPFASEMNLPSGTSNFEIDYTALDLRMPDRVRFLYKLEGVDRDWVDAGTRRQAFYTHIEPGTYEFTVKAQNENGVWNEQGRRLTIVIPPTFLQSLYFKLLVAAVAVLVLLLWLRDYSSRMRSHLEERLRERERVARELHDTLLQGFQGLVLRFQALAIDPPDRGQLPARIDSILVNADRALTDARRRVQNLRGEGAASDLARELRSFEHDGREDVPSVRVRVDGTVNELHPIVLDEVLRVGREAISNAICHASASVIDVVLTYRPHRFCLTVADDGIGMSADLMANGRAGHFGLAGMRERAARIGAELALSSIPGQGTELLLKMRAGAAYKKVGWFRFSILQRAVRIRVLWRGDLLS